MKKAKTKQPAICPKIKINQQIQELESNLKSLKLEKEYLEALPFIGRYFTSDEYQYKKVFKVIGIDKDKLYGCRYIISFFTFTEDGKGSIRFDVETEDISLHDNKRKGYVFEITKEQYLEKVNLVMGRINKVIN